MLRATIAGLAVAVIGCSTPDARPDLGARRDAIGAPRVVWRPAGNPLTRTRFASGLLPLEEGLVVFDDEPWFVLADGGSRDLVDVTPGALPSWDGRNSSVTFGGRGYFTASSSTAGRGVVWETDGTVAGTRELALSGNVDVTELQAWPWGVVVSGAGASGTVTTLWLDGGAVVPLGAVDLSRGPMRYFTEVAGRLYFVDGFDDIYSTDGTDAGLVKVSGASLFRTKPPVAAFAGSAWFIGNAAGDQLWRTNGTAASTVFSGVRLDYVTDLMAWRNGLVVVGTAQNQKAVWRTDGTDAGTTALYGMGASLNSAKLVAAGPTHLYFNASGNLGGGLFSVDGNDGGVTNLGGVAQAGAQFLGDVLLYLGSNGEPWRTDGTVSGTQSLAPGVAVQGAFTPLKGVGAVFIGRTTNEGDEPWVTDGTAAGTRPLGDLFPGRGSGVTGVALVAAGGRHAWFPCEVPGLLDRLCVTDGTPAGTHAVGLPATPASMTPVLWSRRVGGRLLLRDSTRQYAFTPGAGAEPLPGLPTEPPMVSPSGATAWFFSSGALWRTDGTDAGTWNVGAPSFAVPAGTQLVPLEEQAWVRNQDNLSRYRSDAGFDQPLSGLTAPAGGYQLRDLTPVGDELAFFANTTTNGRHLLVTGRVPGGLRSLGSPYPLLPERQMVLWNDALYFSPTVPGVARYWPADGGIELAISGVSSALGALYATPSALYVVTGTNSALHASDGTDAGTRLLVQFPTTLPGSAVPEFFPVGQGALFLGAPRDQVNRSRSQLGWTDGTPTGTSMLPVITQSQVQPFTAIYRSQTLRDALIVPGFGAFMPVWTPETGLEPGFFDPATQTATVLYDLWPGPRTSSPREPALIGNELYFLGDDGSGQGLFVVDLLGTMPVDAGSSGSGGGGGGGANGGGDPTGGGGGTGGGDSPGEVGGGGGDAPAGCGCQQTWGGGTWFLMALVLRKLRRRA